MANDMFNSLSDEQIEVALAQYRNVPSIVTLLEGIKVVREANRKASMEALEAQAHAEQAKVEFASKVAKLAKLPAPPEGIANIFMAYGDVNDMTKPEEVEITKPDGSKVMETRYPKVKEWRVTTNKTFQVGKSGTSKETTGKRAVTVSKREGATNRLIGNFRNYAHSCWWNDLACAGSLNGTDSGERVLTRNGYVYDAYNGDDFKPDGNREVKRSFQNIS